MLGFPKMMCLIFIYLFLQVSVATRIPKSLVASDLFACLFGHFLGVRVAMPDVVDTDQNRNNVGIDRDDVPIHAFQKVDGAVSADAEIDEFEVNVGARSSISS